MWIILDFDGVVLTLTGTGKVGYIKPNAKFVIQITKGKEKTTH